MSRIGFGIVGAGWRAEFFLRIAAAAPEHFEMPVVVARNPEKAKRFADLWPCAIVATTDEMLAGRTLDFAVTSVSWATNPEIVKNLVRRGVPVLCETPYPLAEACQDHYLGLMCEQALNSGTEVHTQTQPWSAQ